MIISSERGRKKLRNLFIGTLGLLILILAPIMAFIVGGIIDRERTTLEVIMYIFCGIFWLFLGAVLFYQLKDWIGEQRNRIKLDTPLTENSEELEWLKSKAENVKNSEDSEDVMKFEKEREEYIEDHKNTEVELDSPEKEDGIITIVTEDLKQLVLKGAKQGYLTWSEIYNVMKMDKYDEESFDELTNLLDEFRIELVSKIVDDE